MHGLTAADAILQKVEEQMEQNTGKNVLEVKVKIGKYLFANEDVFMSAWALIVQDTFLSNAKLTIEIVDGKNCQLSGVLFTD
jgi:Zn finger protein HypA/HybF involved in hydrogenase expression